MQCARTARIRVWGLETGAESGGDDALNLTHPPGNMETKAFPMAFAFEAEKNYNISYLVLPIAVVKTRYNLFVRNAIPRNFRSEVQSGQKVEIVTSSSIKLDLRSY